MSTTTVAWLAGHLEQVLDRAGPHLRVAVGAGQAGDHRQPAVDASLHRGEPGLQRAAGRQPGRGEQPRDLVHDARAAGRPCRRRGQRRPGSCVAVAGPARRRSPAASVVRPGAPAGPQTTTTRPVAPGAGTGAAGGSAGGRAAVGVGSGAVTTVGQRRPARRRPRGRGSRSGSRAPDPARPRRPPPPPPAARRACAGGRPRPRSRPGESRPSTATSAWPALAEASRSSMSTHRFSTTTPGWSLSAVSAVDSHGAPEATIRATIISPP